MLKLITLLFAYKLIMQKYNKGIKVVSVGKPKINWKKRESSNDHKMITKIKD